MAVWQNMTEFYYDLMENKSDPRIKNWPMMSGPFPTIIICASYAYFVKFIGPKLMENRKPFVLRRLMIYYNLFQVIVSTWLFYWALKYGWWNDYSYRCQPVDFSNNPRAIKAASISWWYYIAKFTEFSDTVLFILRKKNDQITTLHVYHHAIMPVSTWFGIKFIPGGHATFYGFINAFVHIIMYGYYLLAAFGPKMHPYLWWKKYLTILQLIQFLLVMIHTFQLFFIECDFPILFAWWIFLQASIFLYIFINFYIQSYVKKENKKSLSVSSIDAKQR